MAPWPHPGGASLLPGLGPEKQGGHGDFILSSCLLSIPPPPWARRASIMASGPEMLQHPPHVPAGWAFSLQPALEVFKRGKSGNYQKNPHENKQRKIFYPSYTSTVNTKEIYRSGQKRGRFKERLRRNNLNFNEKASEMLQNQTS